MRKRNKDFLLCVSYYTEEVLPIPEIEFWNTDKVMNLMWSRMFIWCFSYTDDSLIFIIVTQSEKELWIAMTVKQLAATDEYDLRLPII